MFVNCVQEFSIRSCFLALLLPSYQGIYFYVCHSSKTGKKLREKLALPSTLGELKVIHII